MPKIDKELIWLIRGKQRREILIKLSEKEFMPNTFRKTLDKPISLRELSRHLKDFEKKSIVKCLNPEDPYNRIYSVTEKGKEIRKKLLSVNL